MTQKQINKDALDIIEDKFEKAKTDEGVVTMLEEDIAQLITWAKMFKSIQQQF